MMVGGRFRRARGSGRVREALLGLSAVIVLGCGEGPPTPVAGDALLEMSADMVSYDTETFLSNPEGIRSGRIEADSAYYYQDSTVVHMRGVEMDVYTESGEVRATVTAERGRFDERSQKMHALGNVVLVMPSDGRRVESEELHYDPLTERIQSDSVSTYHHDGQVTRGTCFRSDLSFLNYEVCNIRGSADIGGR